MLIFKISEDKSVDQGFKRCLIYLKYKHLKLSISLEEPGVVVPVLVRISIALIKHCVTKSIMGNEEFISFTSPWKSRRALKGIGPLLCLELLL